MKRYLIFIIIVFCSCSKYEGSKNNLNYDDIKVEFQGYSESYETNEKIIIPVTDANHIKALNKLKKSSKRKLFTNVKGTEYVIRIIYSDSKTGDQLLVRILKSINSEPSIEFGTGTIFDGTFKNNKLIDFVSSLIKLNDIKKYNGILGQKEYEEIVLNGQK